MTLLTIVGARPNFMKAAPIHHAFARAGRDHAIIHTGQHYDAAMSKVFFEDLGLPEPAEYLGVGSGTHAAQTANVMLELEPVFDRRRPDLVLVVGDVNSTMAATLVAVKKRIPVAHVEAGLRSRDWDMPEEVNRVVTDTISDLLLTPSADADDNLAREGVDPKRIVRVGNVMIDSLLGFLPQARSQDTPARLGVPGPRFGVVTLHRPSNVDDPATLDRLLGVLIELSAALPLVFPVHPRTHDRIEAFGLAPRLAAAPQLLTTGPLGYLDFLGLFSAAAMVITDSGGLQEETTALGIPCLTVRENTERPVTVSEGTNIVVGTDPDRIRSEASAILDGGGKAGRVPELWDGHTAERIVDAVDGFLARTGRDSPAARRDSSR